MGRIELHTSKDITLQEGYEEFIRLKRAKNLSEESISNYQYRCNYFMDFAGRETLCSEISNHVMVDYINHVKKTKPNLSQQSVRSYARDVKIFLFYLMSCGYIKRFEIELPRADEPKREIYTEEELIKLLKKPDMKKCDFAEYRNWVMVNYFFGTGNRLDNVHNLKIGDLDLENNRVNLWKTKSRKILRIGISNDLKNILLEYLVHRKGETDDYLFCTVYGKQMSKQGIASALDRYNHRRGVLKTGRHLFRHTFATLYLKEQDGKVQDLQGILGHSTITMSLKYNHMVDNEIIEKHIDNCPLDKFYQRNNLNGGQKIRLNKK